MSIRSIQKNDPSKEVLGSSGFHKMKREKMSKKVLTTERCYDNILFVERQIKYARVAQWWSIALPRRGSRVRIPSRAYR